MTPFTVEELNAAVQQLSPAAAMELERNLFRNRLMGGDDDGVQDESAVDGEATEA